MLMNDDLEKIPRHRRGQIHQLFTIAIIGNCNSFNTLLLKEFNSERICCVKRKVSGDRDTLVSKIFEATEITYENTGRVTLG